MRTSLYSILCMGVRLAAVLLAAYTLTTIPGTFSFVLHGDWGADAWLLVLLDFGVLFFAFLLWVYPGLLARMAAGRASHQVFESPIDASDLQYIAFSIVGLWLFFDGLFGLIHDGVSQLMLRHMLQGQNGGLDISQASAHMIASSVVHVVQLGVGVALVLGARGLVAMLRRARHVGLQPAIGNNEANVEGRENS
jgi:hypothetical protein